MAVVRLHISQFRSLGLWQPFHESCDIVHEDPQLQKRVHLHHFAQRGLQHHTKEQATPFRPTEKGRDGLERLRDAPFKLKASLLHEVTAPHSRNVDMRRPVPHNWDTDTLKGLNQVKQQRDPSLVPFLTRLSLKIFPSRSNVSKSARASPP